MTQINPKLTTISNQVLSKANIPDNQKFGSVVAVLMVISIILTIIRVIQECNKKSTENFSNLDKQNFYTQTIKDYSIRRGWFTKQRIKKIIRQKMCKEDYAKYSLQLTEALLIVGENITDDDVSTLMEQSNV
jgi:hypothetical protein